MILDGAGGECTFMWHSSHPTSVIEKGISSKYLIGKVRDYEDFYSYKGDFYSELKKKVEKSMPKSKTTSDYRLFIKAIVLLILYFWALYKFVTECSLFSAILVGFLAG